MTRKREEVDARGTWSRSRDWFLSKQCDVMRIFLLQIFVGQGVEAQEHIFAACLFYFMLYPNFLRLFLVCGATRRGQHEWRGFLFDSYAGFRVA